MNQRFIGDTPPFTHPNFEIDSLDVPLDCSTFNIVQYRYQDNEPEFTSDVQKWYQLIACTEPVGALNRRSFFIAKDPHPITDAGLLYFSHNSSYSPAIAGQL